MASSDRVTLRVSVTPGLAGNWLAYRVADFQAKHPKIDLEVEATAAVVNLRNGEADVGIRLGAGEWAGCHAVKLFTDELHAVCSPAYLKRAGPFRQPSDL